MAAPTDLSPDELDRARARLAGMAAEFTRTGTLRSAVWSDVFLRTWRHPYIPAYYPDKDSAAVLCIDPAWRPGWLDAVYSDTTLITKIGTVPLSPELRPAHGTVWLSSSTHPSLVLDMLEMLDVADGHRVLEIGTGTGYNAALLCERLGSELVTSIDIDPELTGLAGDRLAAQGYTPSLAAADGYAGHPAGAPYDRIIATSAIPSIPSSWLEQAAPGAVIVADVHGLLGGTVARLTVDDAGTAVGRFSARGSGFMALRRAADGPGVAEPTHRTRWPWLDLPAVESSTRIDPGELYGRPLGFVAQWRLGSISSGHVLDDEGRPTMFLVDGDGNRAEVTMSFDGPGRPVRQYGTRRLWDEVEETAEFWESAGRPGTDRFGLTATPDHQTVWFDDPDGPSRWPLPVPAGQGATGPI